MEQSTAHSTENPLPRRQKFRQAVLRAAMQAALSGGIQWTILKMRRRKTDRS